MRFGWITRVEFVDEVLGIGEVGGRLPRIVRRREILPADFIEKLATAEL